MNERTVLPLTGHWAIVKHIALTRVRTWSQAILLEHDWFYAVFFCFLAIAVIG
jgi:hypothetical protein